MSGNLAVQEKVSNIIPISQKRASSELGKRPLRAQKNARKSEGVVAGKTSKQAETGKPAQKVYRPAAAVKKTRKVKALAPAPTPISFGTFPTDSRRQSPGADFEHAFRLMATTGNKGDSISVQLPRGYRKGAKGELEVARYKMQMAFNYVQLEKLGINRMDLVSAIASRGEVVLSGRSTIVASYRPCRKGPANLVFTMLKASVKDARAVRMAREASTAALSVGGVQCYGKKKVERSEIMAGLEQWSKGVSCSVTLSRSLAQVRSDRKTFEKLLLQAYPEIFGRFSAQQMERLLVPGARERIRLTSGMLVEVSLIFARKNTVLKFEQVFEEPAALVA